MGVGGQSVGAADGDRAEQGAPHHPAGAGIADIEFLGEFQHCRIADNSKRRIVGWGVWRAVHDREGLEPHAVRVLFFFPLFREDVGVGAAQGVAGLGAPGGVGKTFGGHVQQIATLLRHAAGGGLIGIGGGILRLRRRTGRVDSGPRGGGIDQRAHHDAVPQAQRQQQGHRHKGAGDPLAHGEVAVEVKREGAVGR